MSDRGNLPCPRCGGRTVWVQATDAAPSCVADCHLRTATKASSGGAPARLILPMSSGAILQRGVRTSVVSRVQFACLPERIIIGGTPSNWIVHHIRLGVYVVLDIDTQGDRFSDEQWTKILFNGIMLHAGCDFAMVVTYAGDLSGATFIAGVLCRGVQ